LADNILLVGDSMAEAIAKPLEKLFHGTNNNYTYRFKRGTQVEFWLNNQLLFEKLQESNPDYVVISLGTNDLVAKKTNENIIANLDKLIYSIETFGQKKPNFILVAPPIQLDNDLGIAMKEHYGDICFQSKDLNLTTKSDGIHPTREADQAWAVSVYNFLLQLYPTLSTTK
jgi:lysophospholipase L1-like esterase